MQEVLPDQRSFVLEIRFHSLSVEGIFEFPSLRGSLEQKEWVTRIGSDNKRNPHISMKKWSLTESNCFSRISHYPLIPTKPAPGARLPLLTNSDNKFNSFSKQKNNLSDAVICLIGLQLYLIIVILIKTVLEVSFASHTIEWSSF